MTTGRINQVTILSPGAEARRQTPPKGGELYQARRRRSDPSYRPIKYQEYPQTRQLIQLPPLSSPKGGPQRAMTDVAIAYISVTYTPQEEIIYTSSRKICGNSARLSPKI